MCSVFCQCSVIAHRLSLRSLMPNHACHQRACWKRYSPLQQVALHEIGYFMRILILNSLGMMQVLPANFVICSKAERKILGDVLGIQQLSKSQFCR